MCYMEIPCKARKCPYCHQWQNKLSMITLHPAFGVALSGIFITVLFGFMATMLEGIFNKGESFSDHKDSMTPIQTEMKFGEQTKCSEGKYPTVAVIGKIENKSDIYWKDVVIEAQFFNKQGKLIDTKQKEQYGFIVPAHGDSSFKLSFEIEFSKEEYDNYKVYIRSAKDAKAKF